MSTLREVAVGQTATVRTVGCGGTVRRRLLEMGLLPGTEVRVVRRAPMGDPIELRVRGYALSVRDQEASSIGVELQGAEVLEGTLSPAE